MGDTSEGSWGSRELGGYIRRQEEPVKKAQVVLKLTEVNALVAEADKALDGDSNDAEHDALFAIREKLAEFSTDPDRRRL